MNIFITGTSGFIGSNIIKKLSTKHKFYAMVRSDVSAKKVMELGAKPILCELGKVTSEHLKDCDTVIHAAAFTKEWGTKKEYWDTTVLGTKQLLEVAKKTGLKRFLHISTEAILFTGEDLNNIDETYPYPKESKFLYSESKLEAEKLVRAAQENNVFEIMVLRPRLVWGPDDHTVLPVLVNMVKDKKFVWINNGTNLTSTTHIDNLVEGIDCALKNWKQNEVYFITDNETITYKEFLTQYLATQNVVPPDKNISKGLIRTIANIVEFIWRTLNIKSTPPVTKLAAYMLSSNFTINIEKANKDLGYKPIISIAEAMKKIK
ncbi:MAG: NAD-dependent epimerase/dehydratase family protein [Leptospiraceae bacterium]|nr:NAD-dependent epimerase/dehydratase family protein [Leptospiraceae bacterium]